MMCTCLYNKPAMGNYLHFTSFTVTCSVSYKACRMVIYRHRRTCVNDKNNKSWDGHSKHMKIKLVFQSAAAGTRAVVTLENVCTSLF